MKRRDRGARRAKGRRGSSKLMFLGAVLVFAGVFYGLAVRNTPKSTAVKATDFQAGRIIDDAVFYNADTMSVAEIQAVLDKYSPSCDTWGTRSAAGRIVTETGYVMPVGSTNRDYARKRREAGNNRYHDAPYICLNHYYENPETHETLYETNGVVKDGMLSAAQIIYNEAKKYSINPQVLITLLKKESYAWGDSWPLKWEYNSVTGYGCPDNAACNAEYYGFYNQVHMAAWQYNYYRQNINEYRYRPYTTNNIYYSPNASCGTKPVYLENVATTSLYIYTPYTPNDAALANYPGEAYCGSYGNRNFFMFFNEMFGSTLFIGADMATLREGEYIIVLASDLKKTIQVANLNTNNGIEIISNRRVNSELDSYKIELNADKTYTLKNISTGKVIDVPGAEAHSGQTLQQWESNGTSAQKWRAYSNGDGTISLASAIDASLVIDFRNGSSLTLENYSKSKTQKLIIAPIKQILKEDDYTISSALRSNYALDVANGSIIDGANVQTYGINNSAAQSFRISFNAEDGYYTIRNIASGKVLDVSNASINSGANVQMWSANGSCAQKWSIYKNIDNSYIFINACGGKVLDVFNGNKSIQSNIQVWDENNSMAQKWVLTKSASAKFYNGKYIIANFANSNLVLDVNGNNTNNGENIQLWSANESSAQVFKFNYLNTGYYNIIGEKSQKALDAFGGKTDNGTNVQIWEKNSSCAQQWEIKTNINDNSQTIINSCSEKALDITNGSIKSGENIQLWAQNNTNAQKWKIKEIEQTLYDGEYEIKNFGNENYLLDVAGGKTDNGTNVQIWEKNNTNAQKWSIRFVADGEYYVIKTKLADKYLSILNKTVIDGANIGISSKVEDCTQKWKIAKNSDDSLTIFSNCDKSKAVDLFNNNLVNSENIQLFSFNETLAQKWKIE